MIFRMLLAVSLLASCADPKETASKVRERYVGKAITEVYQELGYPEDARHLPGVSGMLVSWYRTEDRDSVVQMGPAAGILAGTCRLTMLTLSGTVTQFQLTGSPEACDRFAR